MSCRLLLDRLVWKRSGRHPLTQWEYRYLLLPARKMLKNRGLRPSSIQGRPGGPRRRDEGGSTTCHAVASEGGSAVNYLSAIASAKADKPSTFRKLPAFSLPRAKLRLKKQLLLLKSLGSPALSHERAAPVKVQTEQHRWRRLNHFV